MVVDFREGFLGHDGPVVVGPSPENRVQGLDQPKCVRAPVGSYDLRDPTFDPLDSVPRWLDVAAPIRERPDCEAQEVEPVLKPPDRSLFLVDDQTPRFQPFPDVVSDPFRVFLRVREHNEVVGVADQHRCVSCGLDVGLTLHLFREGTHSGSRFQTMQHDVQQQWADDTALGSSLLSASSHPTFHDTGLQPLSNPGLAWEGTEGVQQEVMVDVIKRGLKVRVQYPATLGALAG
ncbi:hypothetical protein [Brevibacterium sp. SMBL_HHYL_HB1]|uniref:hypothetical protein n=1 Tax=Brevibacterium sp. SMBL_HHYL_HB1 TaxID=2777556 RepID=UPI001BA96FCA|nr:hypothetical protein [Brevibacterium sp. SMBL_HHYL_HB1]